MKRYDVGMSEGHIEPAGADESETRHLALIAVQADNPKGAIETLRTRWKTECGDYPETPLVGISWAY
jgi:hypothetical protein